VTLAVALGGWALAVAAAALALVLRSRLELVARAEHELRGPATVLSLACERLRQDPACGGHGEALEVELARLRAGLADLAAARHGRVADPAPATVELEPLARSAAAGWEPSLRSAGRDARVDWRAGNTRVVADRGRLAQALGNLLANAAEHGTGPLSLRSRRVPGAVRVEVRNGAAPAAAKRPRNDRGRGLGIAARAAASAGGRLDLETDGDHVIAALELPVEEEGPPGEAPAGRQPREGARLGDAPPPDSARPHDAARLRDAA
jgi:signal transduction histidine kinase